VDNLASIVFLVLFCVSTVLVYVAVRRGWLAVTASAGLGAAASITFFMLFSLAQGNEFTQALIVGVLMGVLFTGLTVAMASFFRNNESTKHNPSA
jgi:ABC-type Fe3+-siderophore transport system permease subunit